MAQFRYEVWPVPGISGTYEKKIAALRPDSASGTLYRRQSGTGQISIPANYDRLGEIINVDPSNHANDVASLIRVYRGSDLIQELLVPVSPNLVADQPAVLGCSGIEAVMDWAITECWDWDGSADFTSTVPDWIYGGRNLIPDLAIGDLGSIREQWELWNDQTPGGTFVLRVTEPAGNPQDTNSLAFNATIQQIEGSNLTGNGLEGLSNVNDVTISGGGDSNDNPWVITFFDPPIISNLQVFDSGGLTSALSQTEAGRLDPSPVTVSQSIDASRNPNTHGTYDDPPIEVVTTPLDTGADWSLLVNATGQYAGSQIVLNGVTPGQIYQASIRVRPTITGLYTLVIHDQFENRIKTTSPRDNSLTAGSFQELAISDIQIPEGVTRVIMRVAVTDPTPANIGDFYVNWQGAEFREGQAATTLGTIMGHLLDDAQTDHASGGFPRDTIDFINKSFTDSVDTSGAAWADAELSVNIPRGMSYRKVLDRVFGQLGYEWNLTPTSGTPGEWDLNVWNPDGRGTDHSAADTPSLLLGQGTLGGSATRQIPAANRVMSEGAGQFTTRARNTASEGTIGSREWYQADVSYRGAQAEEWTDKTLARFLDVSLQPRFEIADPPDTEWPIPIVDYGLADVLNVDLADGAGKVSRSVEAISWRTEADGIRWGVHTGEAQFDAFPTGGGIGVPLGLGGGESRGAAAVAPQRGMVATAGPVNEGVRRLLDEFDRLERPAIASAFDPGAGGGMLYKVICADNEPEDVKAKADWIIPPDDIDAFQAALNAAPFYATIWIAGYFDFPAGGILFFHSSATVRGLDRSGRQISSGADCEIIMGQDTNLYDMGFSGETRLTLNTSCTVTNILTTGGSGTDPFITVNGGGVRIHDVWALGPQYDGGLISSDGHADVWMGHIEIIGGKKGIRMESSPKFYIDFLRTTGVDEEILEVQNCDDWQVGTILDTGSGDVEVAIHIWDTCENGAVMAGSMDGSGTGAGSGPETVLLVEDSQGITVGDEFRILDVRNSHGVIIRNSDYCQFLGQVRRTRGSTNVWDNIRLEGTGTRNRIKAVSEPSDHATEKTRYGINVVDPTVECSIIVDNDLGDPADYAIDAINDDGTDTQWKYPDDPVYGDNFTDCEPTPS